MSSGVVDEGAASTHSARHRAVGAGHGGRAGTCRRGRNTGARWRREARERVTDMNARVSGELREYHAWLDGVEPGVDGARAGAVGGADCASRRRRTARYASRAISPTRSSSGRPSCATPWCCFAPRRKAPGSSSRRGDTSPVETWRTLREAMDWPGCAFEERRRAGKLLGEAHVEELRLVRALLEETGCVETARGGRLRASQRGHALLAGAKGALFAELFQIAFWRLSLNLFGKAECGSWPQQQIGMALWALSTTGDRFQGTRALMVLSVLPDEAVSSRPEWVATTLFSLRVLRPLWWFGLVECRDRGEDLDDARWRKSALFDRFLNFGADLVRTVGALH